MHAVMQVKPCIKSSLQLIWRIKQGKLEHLSSDTGFSLQGKVTVIGVSFKDSISHWRIVSEMTAFSDFLFGKRTREILHPELYIYPPWSHRGTKHHNNFVLSLQHLMKPVCQKTEPTFNLNSWNIMEELGHLFEIETHSWVCICLCIYLKI